MPASNKRAMRVKKRKEDAAQTGTMRKARRDKFDTGNETEDVARDLGNRKKFHLHDLNEFTPEGGRQERFFETYYAGTPIIALLGYPGTGKSRLALQAAVTSALDPADPIDKVVIVRSIAQSGPDTGALPGELEDKIAPFEAAYISLTKEMLKFNNPYKHLKALGVLEFMPTNFLRGVTFDNTAIVVEECQNMDWDELYTIISRLGHNSRVILTGDIRQTDIHRRRRESGLERLEKVLLNMPYGSSEVIDMKLEDVVRSGIVRDFVISDFELSGVN